jgi:hypothetical protein
MKIAVIAWGSLVWDRRILEIAENFAPIGPQLPLEFCRVSLDGRLTIVIDEQHGTPCTTYSAVSNFGNLEAALENLQKREGMPTKRNVGFIVRASRQRSTAADERHPGAIDAIAAWADATDYDAVVWTALASNFHKRSNVGAPFSVEAAMRYLEGLGTATLQEALKYIRSAPAEIQTPVRAAVAERWPETTKHARNTTA